MAGAEAAHWIVEFWAGLPLHVSALIFICALALALKITR